MRNAFDIRTAQRALRGSFNVLAMTIFIHAFPSKWRTVPSGRSTHEHNSIPNMTGQGYHLPFLFYCVRRWWVKVYEWDKMCLRTNECKLQYYLPGLLIQFLTPRPSGAPYPPHHACIVPLPDVYINVQTLHVIVQYVSREAYEYSTVWF